MATVPLLRPLRHLIRRRTQFAVARPVRRAYIPPAWQLRAYSSEPPRPDLDAALDSLLGLDPEVPAGSAAPVVSEEEGPSRQPGDPQAQTWAQHPLPSRYAGAPEQPVAETKPGTPLKPSATKDSSLPRGSQAPDLDPSYLDGLLDDFGLIGPDETVPAGASSAAEPAIGQQEETTMTQEEIMAAAVRIIDERWKPDGDRTNRGRNKEKVAAAEKAARELPLSVLTPESSEPLDATAAGQTGEEVEGLVGTGTGTGTGMGMTETQGRDQKPGGDEYSGLGSIRMPRALEALYLEPLRRQARLGIPTCNLQLRSYSVRNLEFFCDFALRAAYYLGLPASGPVPLPRMIERWTVPKSVFIFKKAQENFERITLRRLIQIKDGHPEPMQIWLAFLQKHAYYGIGMKANLWEYSKLGVAQQMEQGLADVEKTMARMKLWQHMGQYKPIENVTELARLERFKVSAGR